MASMGQEFVVGTVEMASLCFMLSEASGGKIQHFSFIGVMSGLGCLNIWAKLYLLPSVPTSGFFMCLGFPHSVVASASLASPIAGQGTKSQCFRE